MILTITIKLSLGINTRGEWQATIELDEDTLLVDLHGIIQQAVEFDNDHMFDFYLANEAWSREKERFDDENEGVYDRTVGSFFPLPKGKKLFYFFDWGDSWVFRVSKERKKPFEPKPDLRYPRRVDEKGEKPPQYVFDEDHISMCEVRS
ncbi:MAG: plasmid pRiA4b ORF-3 family protein [Psychrosphaera sp.]|nr:plasmid pRiA4b ORF-3 family protein [Psychrosphaera sp.]